MNGWGRVVLAVGVILLVGPLIAPFVVALLLVWRSHFWAEWPRVLQLLEHTLALLALTLSLVLPLSLWGATIVADAGSWGRRWFTWTLLVALSVPLPIAAVAWQSGTARVWSPFAQGLLPAAAIHALVGFPWITLILAQGLIDRDMAATDSARLSVSRWTRFWRVRLPQALPYLGFALLWVAAQTGTEIVVTDLMQVRTFAEEVYTQMVAPNPEASFHADEALGGAVAASLVPTVSLFLFACLLSSRWQWQGSMTYEPERDGLYKKRIQGVGLLCLILMLGMAVPVVTLVIRTGANVTQVWSAQSFSETLQRAARETGAMLAASIAVALLVGVVLTILIFVWAYAARQKRGLLILLTGVAALALVAPGPIVGMGVKQCIDVLLAWTHSSWLERWLYQGPSFAPVAWAWAIRAFPLCVAVLWPEISSWPRDLTEATRIETGSKWLLFRRVLWPAGKRSLIVSVALIVVYCLGEVSASRVAATPGASSVAHDVFSRMHYGVTPDLAAVCLVLLAAVGGVMFALLAFIARSKGG